jgi:multidrug efflux pump subunit AcrA (membrane-fusion protein)
MTRVHRSVLLASIALLPGCGLHGKPTVDRSKALAARPAAAQAASAELAQPARVVAPGVVEAWGGNVELSPREAGWIAAIDVVEGARVDSGQTLAELDDDAQRAALDLARADLAEAEAALGKALRGATPEELRQARAEAEASRARAAIAARDAERSDRLGDVQALAPAQVERASAEAQAQSAVARADDAKLAALERGPRGEDRAAVRDRLAAARARVALAEASLARRRVASPIAGVVLQSRAHAGEFFAVGGAPLFVVGDTSRLQVRLEVDEIDAFRLAPGASCGLYGDDDSKVADGAVFRLAPQMGRRGLSIESPTARADVRVREVFVEAPGTAALVPGQRVWGHVVPSAR